MIEGNTMKLDIVEKNIQVNSSRIDEVINKLINVDKKPDINLEKNIIDLKVENESKKNLLEMKAEIIKKAKANLPLIIWTKIKL